MSFHIEPPKAEGEDYPPSVVIAVAVCCTVLLLGVIWIVAWAVTR